MLNEDIGEKAQQRRKAMEKLQADLSGRREALQKAEDELTANRLACRCVRGQMCECVWTCVGRRSCRCT